MLLLLPTVLFPPIILLRYVLFFSMEHKREVDATMMRMESGPDVFISGMHVLVALVHPHLQLVHDSIAVGFVHDANTITMPHRLADTGEKKQTPCGC